MACLRLIGVIEKIIGQKTAATLGRQGGQARGFAGRFKRGARIAKSQVLPFERKKTVAVVRANRFMAHPLPALRCAKLIERSSLRVESKQFVSRAERPRFK